MSKRLKRRIFDICGLNNLSREDKVRKANAILADSDYKQKICNEIVGASHRDVEKVLKAVATTKASREEQELAELEEDCPEKLNPELEPTLRKRKALRMTPVTNQREVNELINATSEPLEDKPKKPKNVDFYSPEEIARIIAGNYGPT